MQGNRAAKRIFNTSTSAAARTRTPPVYGNASLVSEVARLFPGSPHVDSLRRALTRGNANAAQAAIYKLMMDTSNVNTTSGLLGAWRGYQALPRPQPGQASAALQNFQRRIGANRRSTRKKRKAPSGMNNLATMPPSAFDRLPNNMFRLILFQLNHPSRAKLATALGKRMPDPHNVKELRDIVYASAKVAYAAMQADDVLDDTPLPTLAKRVLSRQDKKHFTIHDDTDDVILRGRVHEARIFDYDFDVHTPNVTLSFAMNNRSKWTVFSKPLSAEAKGVITKAMQEAYAARNNFDNNRPLTVDFTSPTS